MTAIDTKALAQELIAAYANAQVIAVPASARDAGFDLNSAYAVESELVRLRRESGRTTVGRKVGYANKALWRALKLETLVWAHMYDDTVRFAERNEASLEISRMCSPKIEPEIVFKLKESVGQGVSDPGELLSSVEWIALGFEIIDCVFADWKYQPADFVAAFGLHVALIVGEPLKIDNAQISTLVDQLPRFKVSLFRESQLIEEGSGRNSLRSPALCLAELASAISRQSGVEPLRAGELVSSGTLAGSHPIFPNETWSASLEGLDLPKLTLHTRA